MFNEIMAKLNSNEKLIGIGGIVAIVGFIVGLVLTSVSYSIVSVSWYSASGAEGVGFIALIAAIAAAAKDRLSGLLLRFRSEVADVSDQSALAERALTFLHKNLFTSYSVLQTRVDSALETGVYNCVSSAVTISSAVS